MAIKIERIVEEDLNLGVGEVDVTMPGGGTVVGHKIGPHSLNSLSFVASMDGGQPITDGDAAAVVQLDTEEIDVGEWYSPSTFKFLPNVPGRYQFDGFLSIDSFVGTITVSLFKNTGEVVASQLVRASAGGGKITVGGLISLDGTADYVTLRATYSGSGSVTIAAARLSGFITGKYETA